MATPQAPKSAEQFLFKKVKKSKEKQKQNLKNQ